MSKPEYTDTATGKTYVREGSAAQSIALWIVTAIFLVGGILVFTGTEYAPPDHAAGVVMIVAVAALHLLHLIAIVRGRGTVYVEKQNDQGAQVFAEMLIVVIVLFLLCQWIGWDRIQAWYDSSR